MSLAAFAFGVSAVALASTRATPLTAPAGALAASLSLALAISAHGLLRGILVWFVLAMTAASVLVLVLPRRPTRAAAVALTSACIGVLAALAAKVLA